MLFSWLFLCISIYHCVSSGLKASLTRISLLK
uniref:Uncharacterized protein n=1 Tax=Rhizophora mucronata TaxID=61149 RepID=A0A2P2NZX0_RHIMU